MRCDWSLHQKKRLVLFDYVKSNLNLFMILKNSTRNKVHLQWSWFCCSGNYLWVTEMIIAKEIIPSKLFFLWISPFLLSIICLRSDSNSLSVILNSELFWMSSWSALWSERYSQTAYNRLQTGLKPVIVSRSFSGSRCLNLTFSHWLPTQLCRTSWRETMLINLKNKCLTGNAFPAQEKRGITWVIGGNLKILNSAVFLTNFYLESSDLEVVKKANNTADSSSWNILKVLSPRYFPIHLYSGKKGKLECWDHQVGSSTMEKNDQSSRCKLSPKSSFPAFFSHFPSWSSYCV